MHAILTLPSTYPKSGSSLSSVGESCFGPIPLRAMDIDTLMTEEMPLRGYGSGSPPHLISPIVENAILLRSVEFRGALRRFVSIIKVRESDYEPSVRELKISMAGIEVSEAPAAAADVLDGRARD